MKTSERLRKLKGKAVERMQALLKVARDEKRELTLSEQQEYDSRKTEVEELDVTIAAAEKEEAEAAAAVTTAEEFQRRQKAADRERKIRERCKAAKLDEKFADGLVNDEKLSADDASTKIFEELAKASAKQPGTRPHHAEVASEEFTKRTGLMSNILLNRLSPGKYKIETENPYRGMTLMEMARLNLELKGVSVSGLNRFDIATRALEVFRPTTLIGMDGMATQLAGMSTSDFPYILANVANKFMLDAYAEFPSRWRELAYQRNATDFKTIYPTVVSSAEALELIAESGEYKFGKFTESRESYAIKTYGKAYAFTRQMLINDDLAVFNDISAAQGRAAARTEADIFWALITSNPTMVGDSTAVFDSSTHGNYTSSGTAISEASINVGRLAIGLQRGLQSEELNLDPTYIVVPKTKWMLATQYTQVALNPTASSSSNVWIGRFNVLDEPRLDRASTTAWYLATAPSQHQSIVYSYLDGQEGVYQESQMGFNPDGVQFKARIDFGAAWLSYRGWYKNAGA